MAYGPGIRRAQIGELSPEAVRRQLERIVDSPVFSKSARLTAFLNFVVGQTLAGHGDDLKEQVIAVELYGRGGDFDSGVDPIVRVDARRLRDKLREYYAESNADSVIISLPKGSYVPVFEQSAAAPVWREPSAGTHPAGQRHQLSLLAGGAVAIALTAILVYSLRSPSAPSQLRPLASLPGVKGPPSLSPDGNFVAFSWSGPPDQPDRGIFIKSVDGEGLRRLTSGGFDPAWSPDGREIAFSRLGNNGGVFVISQLGGAERKVTDSGSNAAWTPDSATLLVRDREKANEPYGIFSISLKTLERRRVTRPTVPIGDWKCAVSPDGARLAFIRSGIPGLSDVYLVPLASGEPRRITDWNGALNGLAWTPDGQAIVYDVEETGGPRLWRISARVSAPGRCARIGESTGDAQAPSISRPAAGHPVRLAYQIRRQEAALRIFDLTQHQSAGVLNVPRLFQRSSRVEAQGRVSPDGKLVAFLSNRDGANALWISAFDGSNLRRLTQTSPSGAFPDWSPDGRTIAFLNSAGGTGVKGIFVIRIDGGEPKRLTAQSEIAGPPHWSSDGQWIYFMSRRSGSAQVWKVTPTGEHPTQVTRNGGFEAQESLDGKFVYYTDTAPPEATGRPSPVRLMRVPVDGREEVVVLPQIWTFHWSVTEKGIYYLSPGSGAKPHQILRFESGRSEVAGELPGPLATLSGDAAVSRDGRWLLMTELDRNDTDLMLVDKFR